MNVNSDFHWLQKLFHWVMAILVIGMLLIGAGMVHSVSEKHILLLNLHKQLGLAISLLVIVRLYLRQRFGVPELPTTIPNWQQVISRLSHWLLYGLLLCQPLIGLLMQWFGGYSVLGPGHADLPYPHIYSLLRSTHTLLAYSLFTLIVIHLTAALIHGFIFRDHVLSSMTWRRKP